MRVLRRKMSTSSEASFAFIEAKHMFDLRQNERIDATVARGNTSFIAELLTTRVLRSNVLGEVDDVYLWTSACSPNLHIQHIY